MKASKNDLLLTALGMFFASIILNLMGIGDSSQSLFTASIVFFGLSWVSENK